jgi:hypothetical protein
MHTLISENGGASLLPMGTLMNSWLPNLVFSLVGLATGWGITHYYARQAAQANEEQLRLLRKILLAAEEAGSVKLARDASGAITGAQVLKIDTQKLSLTGYHPTITIGKGPPAAGTAPTQSDSS